MRDTAALIRVRGLVQGVGFRPTMWRLAERHGLRGSISNDGEGVRIHVCGPVAAVENFLAQLPAEAPPLARIEQIERESAPLLPLDAGFQIAESIASAARTGVAADAACCAACLAEIFDPRARRYRYPFTNCTHCGPRFTIVRQVPYDRAATSMASFTMCADCAAEYENPADRRFHAQPIACPACGPRLELVPADGREKAPQPVPAVDAADAACTLLQRGAIVAIQGLGGYQFACDATHAGAVERLRAGKDRERKPFALMARDLALIRAYAEVGPEEAELLASPAAPIVLLRRVAGMPSLACEVAPALGTLGFMLPNTPLHHLLLARMSRPIVLTSGNLSDEPQAIERAEAHRRLGKIADYFLEHDRPIERRVDDSVAVVVAGVARVRRRARGLAPAALPLPPGFAAAPRILSYGAELKNTFCLLRDGAAILSTHIGDLRDARTRADQRRALADARRFFDFTPEALACDMHPDYSASRDARAEASARGVPCIEVQHHHAHIAACLGENGIARDAPPVIGVALDGLGFGEDGSFWGGEFLLADYASYRRVGTFKPVALLGGAAAVREPWRSTYAHLVTHMDWSHFAEHYADLELYRFLERRPRAVLDRMLLTGVNSPLASSCGRLFEAAAAAMGFAREHASYEGQGAIEMEAAVDADYLAAPDSGPGYPFAIERLEGLPPCLEASGVWAALFADLKLGTPVGVMAARFHCGLAHGIVRMVELLAAVNGAETSVRRVALSGGVFQNRILFERVLTRLQQSGFEVLTHREVPCNDGGLALGQALITAARLCGDRSPLMADVHADPMTAA